MRKPVLFKQPVLLILACIFSGSCFSQNNLAVGINFTGGFTSSSDFVVVPGLTLEKQIKKHSGFETGLYYKTVKLHGKVFVDGRVYGNQIIKENYISVPVLYKFNSSLLNFSVGPTFDFYTGWKQSKKGIVFPWIYYAPNHKFIAGFLGKVSKTVGLTKRFFLEPEIRYNPVLSAGKSFYGIGISGKYRFGK